MQRIHLTSFLFLISLAACAPSTSFEHVDVAYQPSANMHERETRIAPSAVTISESDVDAIKEAGGVYLGELELRGERGAAATQQSGATNLVGRASLEAAARGATHFMLVAGGSHVEHHVSPGAGFSPDGPTTTVSSTSEQIVVARFALMRVEPAHWNDLKAALRPTPMPQS